MVLVGGDDVYEDIFGANFELAAIASEAGFAASRRMGLGSVAWFRERGGQPAVMALYTAMPEARQSQQQALADAVASGMGLVAVHTANVLGMTAAGGLDPAWRTLYELIGCRYASHGPHPHESRFTVELDPAHPLTQGIAPFPISHEHYQLELASTAGQVIAWRDAGDHREPILIARQHGRGRTCYLQLGHDMRVWREPAVRQILNRAFRWAAEPALMEAAS